MRLRSVPIVLHDAAAVVAGWALAYVLRFNFEIPADYQQGLLRTLPVVLSAYLVVFALGRIERGLWRFASLPDIERILLAVLVGALLSVAALAMSSLMVFVPRAVAIFSPLLIFLFMSASRLMYRRFALAGTRGDNGDHGDPGARGRVIIMGAGSAASLLLRDMSGGTAATRQWRVAGLLDDDPIKRGRQINGVTVLGSLAEIGKYARKLGVTQAVIAMPSAPAPVRKRAAILAEAAGMSVMTVPGMDDLLSGRVAVSQIRSVDPDELLERDSVTLDEVRLRDLLAGRVVMVTGAGGSIGSELCRQIARFGPHHLVLFEMNEYALYTLEQEFRAQFPALAITCAIGDVKDAERMRQILNAHRPEVLFHAAAYKHVPLMEAENVWEAVRNNVAGTLAAARAAAESGVSRFVLVSTDKAVNPTNVMGATKRLAEMVCQALQEAQAAAGGAASAPAVRFSIVRFGNVLGSSGSVIPKFREQIAAGGPVTVTHPDIVRYFMSVREAAQLVLQAAALGQGGEIFVLDMGAPVKIVNLARSMIRLSGFAENEIAIEYTGLRPGEKLYEELLFDSESTLGTPHPKLRIARARPADARWLERLEAWLQQPGGRPDEVTRGELREWVPEYTPARNAP